MITSYLEEKKAQYVPTASDFYGSINVAAFSCLVAFSRL